MNSSQKFEIGVIGLGTMGRNLLMNLAEHGYPAIGLDKDSGKSELVRKAASAKLPMDATENVRAFIERLRTPRAIILLVPAGAPVDAVIAELTPLLAPGDLIMDAGNSHFKETDRREKALVAKGIHFFGMGVSGGEAGARFGPSIMPGGNRDAYARVQPILEAIAAHVKGSPCVSYMGPGSAGHYVKMVHNGIEYGLMQLIAETYALMKTALSMSDDQCHEVYRQWNGSELNSYLLEITANIFLKEDEKTGRRLIDVIRDVAKQKGTGMWVCQDAMELQVPVPTIDAAVTARDLSSFAADRAQANATLYGPDKKLSVESTRVLEQLRESYYASSIITFAQGMAQLQRASVAYHYELNLETVARIWRGGCIIRAAVLEPMMVAYHKNPRLSHLLLDPYLAGEVGKRQLDLRGTIQTAVGLGIPVPALMASLGYYDGYRSLWLPANLIQAQRDYFGAHTFERIDEPGTFHADWTVQ